MFEKLKKIIDSFWARSKVFKIIIMVTIFLFMVVVVCLSTWYLRILFGVIFSIFVLISRLVFGIVAHKTGYVEKVKAVSPKGYSNFRMVQCTVGGGFFTGFAILTALRVLYGPLPYPHGFILFLILIVVGAIIFNRVGRKLRWY